MSRDSEPVTEAEFEALRAEMERQRTEIRAYLAERGVEASNWGLS